ncbi:MAG: aromatic ring-hydroxylating dioxygenase subunit alpha [Betaproteobacteria bacterium]|nr:aromatic ring-hydroxylating dioxygenase subunit alpha [Betaproteobacteria bacterium]
MLSVEENELLVRTGAGTSMGALMRRYWIPVLFSTALSEPDCAPLRVKVLGEKLVAFRSSNGRIGLFDERCPHRNASLFFGRNEEEGLRCVYHGWKFDVEGLCVDMPSEPPESQFRHRLNIDSYPCLERGGVIWAYMGPPDLKPEFPELEWTLVPASQRFATRHIQECNWLQAFEGGFDTSHVSFLHRGDVPAGGDRVLPKRYEVIPKDFGFTSAAGRASKAGELNWLANIMFMPFHKLISRHGGPDAPIGAHAWVPVDDEHCMIYSIEYHPNRPLADKEMERSKNWRYIHAEPIPGTDRTVANKGNDYLVNRSLQKSGKSFTGMPGFGVQDCGIQESMGRISDRTREHLGKSDTVVIRLRRVLLDALKSMAAGLPLPGLDPKCYRVRSAGFSLPESVELADVVDNYIRADTHATETA